MFARMFDRNVSTTLEMPHDWLAGLRVLVETLNRKEYKTLDALLVAIAGDFAGSRMLWWLLYWMPKASRADGGVWKSAPDWQAEVGLTRHQVERLKRVLVRCGVSTDVLKAEGSPQTHYWLDEWIFLKRVGEVLRLPPSYLLMKMKSGDGFTGKRQMDLPDSVQSLTTDSTTETTKSIDGGVSSPTVSRLIEIGVGRKVAETLADKPLDAVEDVLRQAYRMKDAGELRSFTGFVVSKLRECTETPPPKPLMVRSDSTSHVDDDREQPAPSPKPGLSRFLSLSQSEPIEIKPVNERLLVEIGGSFGTPQAAWSAIFQQVERQLDVNTFNSCLRNAKLVDWCDGVFVVRVANAYARDMCEFRLNRLFQKIMYGVIDAQIRFEADEQRDTPSYGLQRFLDMSANK